MRGPFEMLIGAVLVVIALLTVISAIRSNLGVRRQTGEFLEAQALAVTKLEELMSISWSGLLDGCTCSGNVYNCGSDPITWIVETLDPSASPPRFRKITVLSQHRHLATHDPDPSGKTAFFVGYRYNDF